jgi:hypothetical protein
MAGAGMSSQGGARAASYKGNFTWFVMMVAIIGGSAGGIFGIDNGEYR